ncbi:TPA: hypothetical protein ACX39U_000331 [Klebsiella pneumoniae]|jgi:hypothetical protein|uniref:hypothetical protein n=1 Tax=Klebsiella/Raoultella group TaxID=2890311 RepID=UPI000BD164F3|nr:hypothetical protein [Klebsiella pneumoniae]MCS6026736.1 hypothetical protein [Klebsiella pneumoniae subsp. pneumoniae]HBT5890863.1 hypothetical protein [Klebsiella quasipneumoniae]HBU8663454.1 hypothetical protein [Klebsiella oxytoca]HEC2559743.1 hypothetical protein [Raoultella ornithinolytica]MBE4996351.1 hypothetical protein [Klebsiella pneumoniae]
MQDWFVSWEYNHQGTTAHGWNIFSANVNQKAIDVINQYIKEMVISTGFIESSIIIKAFNKV